ncbi:MAG: ABC transporter substrate-binding protein [Promicromonosporaceae bacterium]|nr:ABC transporter substrate-binding protein [Promicromonosporaceae bacterium]
MRTHLRKGRTAAAAVAATAMLTLAACGGDNGNGGDADPTPDDTNGAIETPVTGNGDTPATSTGGGGGVLNLAMNQDPGSFNIVDSGGNALIITAAIYDTLVMNGPDAHPVPAAAESWEFSADGLALTMTLRDDLSWTDGVQVTTTDVVATLEMLSSTPGINQGHFTSVTGFEAIDELTFQVNFSEPDVTFLWALANAPGVIGRADMLDAPNAGTNPMGSGPFILNEGETIPGAMWVLDRRPDHWNAAAFDFDQVRIHMMPDPTAAVNALRSGQIDWTSVPAADVASVTEAGFEITQVLGTAQTVLRIFDRDGDLIPALGDVRVRQAINYALDREGFVMAMTGGLGTPTNQMILPSTDVYLPELANMYAFDLDRAHELMAEAGFADGFEVTMPSIPWFAHTDPLITSALGELGIRINWEAIPPAEVGTAVMSGRFPMAIFVEGDPTLPTHVFSGNYSPDGVFNPFGSTDPVLTPLVEQFMATLDTAARAEVGREVNRFVIENAWDAPILINMQMFANREGIVYHGTPVEQLRIELFTVAG